MKTSRIAATGLWATLRRSSPAIANADVVLEVDAIMVTVVADQPPPAMNRFAAITQLAVFEAVNAATGDHPAAAGTIDRVARRLRRRGGDRCGPWRAAPLLSRPRRCWMRCWPARSAAIPTGPPRWAASRSARRQPPARCAARANRRLGNRLELYVLVLIQSGEWQLTSDCPTQRVGVFLHWRNVIALALGRADAVPLGLASGVDRQQVHAGLQRGQGGRCATTAQSARRTGPNVVRLLCRA